MIAICTIRPDPHYRREAFCSGLSKAGFTLSDRGDPRGPTDMLVIWNRYGAQEARADQWEKDGGTVLVAENGYIGKDDEGRQLYALAVHGHNGSGWWPVGSEDRWATLGVEVLPFVRRNEGYSLICGQRGIGSRTMASPPDWHILVSRKLQKQGIATKIRPHPGNRPAATKLEDDLNMAERCVVWSSSSGVKALTMGIPVQYDAPHWICAGAATKVGPTLAYPDDETRLKALQRMAHAQWKVAELETGEPFTRILEGVKYGAAKW